MINLKLGFLASGRGSNMQTIINACRSGILKATPVVVICNNADAGALKIARSENIPSYHLSSRTHTDKENLDRIITETLKKHDVDLVVLAGYMKKVGPLMLKVYKNRILNIHPALLPKFGGPGMYGMHVHKAVLESGDKKTGATVHLVDDEYDKGKILAQREVQVAADDTSESLAARVLAVEHTLYTEVLRDIISDKIKLLP